MGWSIAIFCRIFSHTIKFEYYFDVRLLINVVPLLWNKPNRSTNRLIKCIKLITIYCQSPRAEYTGINASRIQLAQHAIGNIIDEPAVGEVVVPALEVVKARFAVVVIAAVTQGIDVPDEGGIRGLFAVSIVHGIVAPRAVGAAAQRDTAGNDDDLWLCADGCTHHSDRLSISLRAVLMHRPRFVMKLVNDRKNSLIPRRKIFRIIVQRFPRPDLMESNRKGITTAYCNVDCKLLLRILRLDIIIDEPAKNRRVYSQFRKLFI